jgi:hypothetical protein
MSGAGPTHAFSLQNCTIQCVMSVSVNPLKMQTIQAGK